MSSPKAARKKPPAPERPAHSNAVKRAAAKQPAIDQPTGDARADSAAASRMAATIERALAEGRHDVISTEALQALMAAVCKVYGARVEAGEQLLPLPERGGATATEVMITASGLLKSADLAVFELGMWQSWTGR